jgi:hypothetical protein
MPASPQQIAANRANARKSTGPKTLEGKEIARRNALKHGLTGACVVVPDEDVNQVEACFDGFDAELNPQGAVGQFLARRAALLSLRLDRCARAETALVAPRILEAERIEEDAARVARQHAIDQLATDPTASVRHLMRSPEGIAWLIATWGALRVDLLFGTGERWGFHQRVRAENLLGNLDDHLGDSPVRRLSGAIHGDFRRFGAEGEDELPDDDRRAQARQAMLALIDANIAQLEQTLAHFDHAQLAQTRAGARARAIVDPSPQAQLIQKYERATASEFYKTLIAIDRLNRRAEAAETVEPKPEANATPSPETTSAELASFGSDGAATPEAVGEAVPEAVVRSRPRLPGQPRRGSRGVGKERAGGGRRHAVVEGPAGS